MIVVAVASGTSADGLDVAVVELEWTAPASASLRVVGIRPAAWPDRLRSRVLALLPPASTSAEEWCRLDNEVGQLLAGVAAEANAELADGRADLVVSPGQTVHHDVVDGHCRGTLQIGQPAWIAEATGLPVVSDLRSGDVAAGGHGAPLVALFDAAWLARPTDGVRVALNLGGIANVTVVGGPDDPVVAFDTGPANCLLDVAAHRITQGQQSRDDDGRLALAGRVRPDLLTRLLDHPYFRLPPPKSTGREMFSAALLDRVLGDLPPVHDVDLLATLTELTARTVAAALDPHPVSELVVSGGGVRNPALMAALRTALPEVSIVRSDVHGIPADAKEAVMWALLGFLAWHGVPGTAPGPDGGAATGARATRPLGRISLSPAGPRPPRSRPDPLRTLAVLPNGAVA